MHRESTHRTGNHILDHLPEREHELLLTSAEIVSLDHGMEVYALNGAMPHVYFPIRGVLSANVTVREGKSIEAVTIGSEGMAGLHAYWGLDFSPVRIVSQMPGEVLRLPTASMVEASASSPALDRLMRRYASFALCSANQTVTCNALHSSEQRICHWLLGAHDRADTDHFAVTHELLAEMLGVRRQTVTVLAGQLQKQGLIHYRRGSIEIFNRAGLEAASCECYSLMHSLYERIMN